MTKTFGSLFSGGGGADIGAMQAGYTPVFANEYDPAIADCYRSNIGDHIRVGDILTQDPRDYPRVNTLHASPPCPNFSVAKTGAKETEQDIALADKVAEFIRVLAPDNFTLENVSAYADSESFERIVGTLERLGYWVDARVLNSADYAVPQTRRRLFVRASRNMLRPMPAPVEWVGWYAAIVDLLPTMPESKFADWQLNRLPPFYSSTLVDSQIGTRVNGERVLLNNRGQSAPALTVRGQLSTMAFIANTNQSERGDVLREQAAPAYSVTSLGSIDRSRAWLSTGRVVQMTPRALARFQSFPDWYKLPDKKSLACRIIGNAVPPLMYQQVLESLT